MKKALKQIFAVICTAVVAISAVIAAGAICDCAGKLNGSGGDFKESLEKIDNPDQGFYRPIYVKVTDGGAAFNKNIITDNTQLYHLRIDISAYSSAAGGTDKPLSENALDGITELLQTLKDREKSAVVRFAYDPSFGGKKDAEPSFDVLLNHIGQFCPILNDFESTVTAIEAGLIGPWGEMHSSAISDSEHTTAIIDKYLKSTINLPVLVRTPKKIYDYMGVKLGDLGDYDVDPASPAYRLGVYNDGYLGSDSDLGTFSNREKEVAYFSKANGHLPYGGEAVVPSCTLHDIENCTKEMFELSLSYLNVEWNNEVIDKWKNTKYTSSCGNDKNYYGQTAFTYIQNRLGYRFVPEKCDITYNKSSGEIAVNLKLNNVGFGNLNKPKRIKLIIADETDKSVFESESGIFRGETEIKISDSVILPEGNYKIYICLYGDNVQNRPIYAVQFACDGIWNKNFKANSIGELKV